MSLAEEQVQGGGEEVRFRWASFAAITALLVVAAVGVFSWRMAARELDAGALHLETGLAEKLAQHEAHLTALSAVIRTAVEQGSGLTGENAQGVQGLAVAILEFYPRIIGVSVSADDGSQVIGFGTPAGPTRMPDEPAPPPLAHPGATQTAADSGAGTYLIYKLVRPGLVVRLEIDARRMLDEAAIPSGLSASLSLGETMLTPRDNVASAPFRLALSRQIANPTQPLRLDLVLSPGLAQILPLPVLAPLLALAAVLLWLSWRSIDARRNARLQDQKLALLEQEARMAHAARIGLLGEMASGIAHELSQPVAALSGQSQAAKRALALDMPEILAEAIDANIREARRAGDILGRMRAYIGGTPVAPRAWPLRKALEDALQLIRPELDRRGIVLRVDLSGDATIRVDHVVFQQVLHNLLMNAAEAMAQTAAPVISITTGAAGAGMVALRVADNGPGIAQDDISRIFQPFFTTKPDGMGLGLSLSERLTEAMSGRLTAGNDPTTGGAVFTLLLPEAGRDDLSR